MHAVLLVTTPVSSGRNLHQSKVDDEDETCGCWVFECIHPRRVVLVASDRVRSVEASRRVPFRVNTIYNEGDDDDDDDV